MIARDTISSAMQALENFMRLFEAKESFIERIKESIDEVDRKGLARKYRLGKEISKTAIREYEEETGEKLTESPF